MAGQEAADQIRRPPAEAVARQATAKKPEPIPTVVVRNSRRQPTSAPERATEIQLRMTIVPQHFLVL